MKLLSIPAIFFPLLFLCTACQQAAPAASDHPEAADTPQKSYFPVLDFLKGEIAQVDSFPFRLMEYHIRNGKTDSTLISTQRFNQLAAAFLPGDLDSSRFRKRFREQAFLDQTTGLLSFTYSTTDTLFGLRRVDVLAEPGPGSDKVRSIYMELSSGNTDSPALRKLYWVAGKSFSILQINRPLHGEATTDQTRVLWDGSE